MAMAKTTTTFRQGGKRWLGVSKGRGGDKSIHSIPAIKLARLESFLWPVSPVDNIPTWNFTQPAYVAASVALDSSVRLNVEDWAIRAVCEQVLDGHLELYC